MLLTGRLWKREKEQYLFRLKVAAARKDAGQIVMGANINLAIVEAVHV